MEWYFVQLAFMRLWGRLECAKSRNNGVICVIIISYYTWRMLSAVLMVILQNKRYWKSICDIPCFRNKTCSLA